MHTVSHQRLRAGAETHNDLGSTQQQVNHRAHHRYPANILVT